MDKVREKLGKYKEYKVNIKQIDIQLEELEENIGIQGQSGEERTGKTYKITSSTETQAIELESDKKYLIKERRRYEREVEKIDNALEVLTDFEREILIAALIERKRYWLIQSKYNYTYSNIKKIEKSAIKKISKYIN